MRAVGGVLGVVFGVGAVLAMLLLIFGIPVGEGLNRIFDGSFGTPLGLSRTAVKATPLLLTALGVVVAWKAGLYNIGGEGQFVIGGVFGAWMYALMPLVPPAGMSILVLLGSVIGGALYAWLAAWLWVKRSVQIVISTILLNFVALQILDWAVRGPLQERAKQLPQTEALPSGAMLLRFQPQSDVHLGVLLSLLVAVAVWFYLSKTRTGFQIRLVGANASAARANGVPVPRIQLLAMSISGGLCGLAGGIEYLGISGRLDSGFDQQWGFLGIPVALLAALNPLGAILSSLLFGGLYAGSIAMTRFAQGGDRILFTLLGISVLGYLAYEKLHKSRLNRA